MRSTIGQLLLTKLSDPRIDPAKTTITHVEVPEDLLTAKVYVSVLGTEGEQRRTIRALQHAAGHVQKLMMRDIQLRHTPVLDFELDTKLRKTMQTLGLIEEAMDEIRQGEQDAGDEAGTAAEPSQ